jgi:L-lactate utilization protein LutC
VNASGTERESGDRRSFLVRVASRSSLPTTPHLISLEDEDEAVAGVAYTPDLSDLVAAYAVAAEGNGTTVYVVRSDADRLATVLDIASSRAGDVFYVSDEPASREFGRLLEQAGVATQSITDPRHLTRHDTVVTAAAAGIALTGSIVLASGMLGSRLVTTLPRTHIALLEASALVPTPREVYRGFAEERWPGSALTIATGPSRSGDIEMEITVGVHGPGEVVVVVDARV